MNNSESSHTLSQRWAECDWHLGSFRRIREVFHSVCELYLTTPRRMFKFSHIKVTSVAGTRLKPHQSEALWVVYSISNDYVFCLLLISTEKCLPIVDNVISLVHHTIRPTPVCCVWMTHQPLKAGAHTIAIISLILPLIAPRHNQHRASLFRVPIFPHCCLSFSLLIVCKVKRYFHLVLLSLRLMIITMSIWWWMSKTISEQAMDEPESWSTAESTFVSAMDRTGRSGREKKAKRDGEEIFVLR